jgi:KRAB domain-containing zinc finger protein
LAEHEGQSPYPCDHCGKGFLRKSALQQHLKTHQVDRFVCVVKDCGFKCSKWSEWVHHRRMKHPPKCIKCGQEFTKNQGLELHYRKTLHDGRDPDPTPLTLIRCKHEQCDKVFTRVTL